MLTDEQQEHFARHLLLDGWEGEGQERLLDTCVRIVGDGRAAHWAARYLAASGVTVVAERWTGELRRLNPWQHERDARTLEVRGDDPAQGARIALEAVCAILRK